MKATCGRRCRASCWTCGRWRGTVEAGTVLVVLEAMKMEHSLSAPWHGTVSTVSVKPGDRVQEGSDLVLLEPVQVDSSWQPADPV